MGARHKGRGHNDQLTNALRHSGELKRVDTGVRWCHDLGQGIADTVLRRTRAS
jgi:hypothetical protein